MTEKDKRYKEVFISYQTDDKAVAGKIKKILSDFGMDSFLAHEDIEISVEWQDEILKHIKNSSFFICLLSKNYLNSVYCMQESGMAIILDLAIIPLSLDGTVSPGFISKFQSKKINNSEPSFDDIIPGIINHDRDEGIRIIIERIGVSGTYRDAESNFKYILPYLDDLTDRQAEELIEKTLDNNQVTGAHLCASDYIPRIAQKYNHLLTKRETEKIKRICSVYGIKI
jgi:hypothetical protein